MDPIRFQAVVAQIRTLADGGLRFTFDAPEDAIAAMADLQAARVMGAVLDVVCTPKTLTGLDNETEKGSKGSDPKVGSRRVAIRRDKQAGG